VFRVSGRARDLGTGGGQRLRGSLWKGRGGTAGGKEFKHAPIQAEEEVMGEKRKESTRMGEESSIKTGGLGGEITGEGEVLAGFFCTIRETSGRGVTKPRDKKNEKKSS